MYLRQTDKWKQYLLQEGVEDIGLGAEVAHFLRQLNRQYGPVPNKALTWIGTLVKDSHNPVPLTDGNIAAMVDLIEYDHGWPWDEALKATNNVINNMTATRADPGEFAKEFSQNEPDYSDSQMKALEDYYGIRTFLKSLVVESRARAAELEGPSLGELKTAGKKLRRMLKKANVSPNLSAALMHLFTHNVIVNSAVQLTNWVTPILKILTEDFEYYDELRDDLFTMRYPPADQLRAASALSDDTLRNPPRAEDQVIHEFDNGYYWYDIRSRECDFEARKMGHCGSGQDGTLYSLRAGGTTRRNIKPKITLEMDRQGIVYQIKGKANEAPKKELWPYIDWFIENAGVERVTEDGTHSSDGLGFAEMIGYLKQKHPDVKFEDSWVTEATELLEQFAPGIESDHQTTHEIEWPSTGSPTAVFTLRHFAYWPVKDVIVDESTNQLRWQIRQDAQEIANDTLDTGTYTSPGWTGTSPRIHGVNIFARGIQDSQAAMIRVEMLWQGHFEPEESEDENIDVVQAELKELTLFLAEMEEIAANLVNTHSVEDFDYNGFWEQVQKKLEEYGVYRDIAGELDAEEERESSGQIDLPLQESRTLELWSKIIK